MIYTTHQNEFEYGIYEDVLKTEQLMAELKQIDEAENENKKSWMFTLEIFHLNSSQMLVK